MDYWKQFKAKSCTVGLKASTKHEALAEAVRNMISAGVLPKELEEDAIKALTERERRGSTGLGMNVAIPHVKLSGLERVACNLSVHAEGLEWQAVDGAPVHILFTIIRPESKSETHDPERHLEMLRWISRLSRDSDFRRFAVRVKTKTELVDLLKEMSAL
jgi:mannitol/fructose-specific phosphotransferase system IIA component (Ntr-type)